MYMLRTHDAMAPYDDTIASLGAHNAPNYVVLLLEKAGAYFAAPPGSQFILYAVHSRYIIARLLAIILVHP